MSESIFINVEWLYLSKGPKSYKRNDHIDQIVVVHIHQKSPKHTAVHFAFSCHTIPIGYTISLVNLIIFIS